ncbi:MAG TPA: hypothetical protein VNZ05_09240 [Solirubrobacteraceae bacterium]|nr:hypothetical protein [Solirubrobacteraceae bacterium]
MSDALLVAVFSLSAVFSLGFSWVFVITLERIGARLALTEALLGMLAALGADAPEITAAVTALAGGHTRIGAGVVLGSNVFNLAALLGLAALVAGRIALHRRVIEMNGAIALWVAAACLAVVLGGLSPLAGLLAACAAFVPYLVLLGVRRERMARLALPATWVRWLLAAVREEEVELEAAIHPPRASRRDAALALVALLVVVGASMAMERSAATFATRHAVSEIIVGAVVLAAVTSLPNAVAATYLAARGRGAAVLSTALNSNAINVLFGLLLPGSLVGLGAPSGQTTFVTASYAALTLFALAGAYLASGLRRSAGAFVIGAYLAFVAVLLVTAG